MRSNVASGWTSSCHCDARALSQLELPLFEGPAEGPAEGLVAVEPLTGLISGRALAPSVAVTTVTGGSALRVQALVQAGSTAGAGAAGPSVAPSVTVGCSVGGGVAGCE